jgi:hypothetical protein
MNRSLGRGDVGDNLSFTSATSDATGKDRRTVERAAARGEALGDDLNDIAGTSLDKGVERADLERDEQIAEWVRLSDEVSPHVDAKPQGVIL